MSDSRGKGAAGRFADALHRATRDLSIERKIRLLPRVAAAAMAIIVLALVFLLWRSERDSRLISRGYYQSVRTSYTLREGLAGAQRGPGVDDSDFSGRRGDRDLHVGSRERDPRFRRVAGAVRPDGDVASVRTSGARPRRRRIAGQLREHHSVLLGRRRPQITQATRFELLGIDVAVDEPARAGEREPSPSRISRIISRAAYCASATMSRIV